MHLVRSSTLAVLLAVSAAGSLAACNDQPVSGIQNIDERAPGSIEVFVGADDRYYFRLVSGDGDKLLRSSGYETKQDAESDVARVKRAGVDAASYQLRDASDGRYYFDVVVDDEEILATSSDLYASKQEAGTAVATVQKIFEALRAAEPRVTCSLTRLAEVPQGAGEIKAELVGPVDEDWASSDGSLEAFEGAYSFDIGMSGDEIEVYFYENVHVEDETGSLGCGAPPAERGKTFCSEPIEIDASLGTDAEERMVHAFDFSCRVD
jgi:uncharacterized protein